MMPQFAICQGLRSNFESAGAPPASLTVEGVNVWGADSKNG